jgi:hypothetical protein
MRAFALNGEARKVKNLFPRLRIYFNNPLDQMYLVCKMRGLASIAGRQAEEII